MLIFALAAPSAPLAQDLGTTPAAAYLRPEWTVERTGAGRAHVVGYLQLTGDELKSMAVAEDRQQHGIGRALVEHAVRIWRHEGFRTVRVATATASIDNLRFYQRLGFRMLEIERDAFTEAEGYATGMVIDGIPLRDRVWLTLDLQRI